MHYLPYSHSLRTRRCPRSVSSSLFVFHICLLLFLSISGRTVEAAATSLQQNSANDQSSSKNADNDQFPACTAVSARGNFFDLRALTRVKDVDESDFYVKGYDYGHNFTMNICAPVISTPDQVEGISDPSQVSAYYTTEKGERFSIGSISQTPVFRGRRLVLEYSGGSPCPNAPSLSKSTIVTMRCDRELLAGISLSFVGQLHECAYFFEARTPHACAKAGSDGKGADTLGPFGIFAAIVGVMIMVYLLVVSRRRVPYVHAILNSFLGLAQRLVGWKSTPPGMPKA
ncbi:mannose-6-phosphate receptor binding domain-containing protein [Lipomyces oligophaga]|uniref:mannose-6-phosphate receptor binding domain-containing protein n=1 Tax=Lipomyces oligophaga TaxID=45792 RepID=UPI0034CD94CA